MIHKLIYCDQTAYVHGKNIDESIIVIDDILEYVDKIGVEGILFAVKIEKAFDSVDHSFIFATLKTSGFGDSFTIKGKRGKVFLKNLQSCVINDCISPRYPKTKCTR